MIVLFPRPLQAKGKRLVLIATAVFLSALPAAEARDDLPGGPAGQVLTREQLLADARELARLLEESHPDPYSGGGGRIAFHRRLHRILSSIPPSGMTRAQFLRLVQPLVASVRDGHTQIRLPGNSKCAGPDAWLGWGVVGRGLYVAEVYRPEDRWLLGSLLASINGVPFDELTRRMGEVRGFDNTYNNLVHLAEACTCPPLLAQLFGTGPLPDPLVFEVLTPDGKTRKFEPEISGSQPGKPVRPETKVPLPEPNAADMCWTFLDRDGRVALLRIDSMARYREAFEVWKSTSYINAVRMHLEKTFRRATGKEPPNDVDAAIQSIPSATELLSELTGAMRSAGTQVLIVDLRKNRGGNSFMNWIVAFHLFGPSALPEVAQDEYQIKRYSRLYFENYGNVSLAEINRGREVPLQIGDYDFSEEDEYQRRKSGMLSGDERRKKEKELMEYFSRSSPTFYRALRQAAAPYRPRRIVVLTYAFTYSAGFDLAAMLYKRGAAIVGVPPSQAGNCYIDTLFFTLTNSRLTGTISHKYSVLFPDDPDAGRVLRPAVELDYSTLRALHLDPNASVLLALDFVEAGAVLP